MRSRLVLAAVLVAAVPAARAHAQISPGPLARVHAALEGSRNCFQCHEASKGVSAARCLACHKLLGQAMAAGKGLHARPDHADCKICHVEHQGVDAELVWWGKVGRSSFDHRQTGYTLEGRHVRLDCPACHQAKLGVPEERLAQGGASAGRTYLGLASACVSCHADEHRGQFTGRECTSCHGQEGWKPAARFDHARTTYPLTGQHTAVACAKCHPAASSFRRFKGLAFGECSSCHEDVHRGRFGASCSGCHNTGSWKRAGRSGPFDHKRTDFPLRGLHASVACDRCHKPGLPLRLPFGKCTDCHADPHLGQFARRADQGRCEACHDVNGFKPARFVVEDHQKTAYPLAGAHLAVPCDACHKPVSADAIRRVVPAARTSGASRATQFRFPGTRCADCHRDPHQGEVSRHVKAGGCEACHRVESWREIAFDHAKTRFALAGKHAKRACGACHKKTDAGTPRERIALGGLPLTCEGCHRDPHQGQFVKAGTAVACDRCHAPDTAEASRFDHKRDASWPLDGAHARIGCGGCHRPEKKAGIAFVRYKPLPTTCRGCHGGSVPPAKKGRP